MVARKQHEHVDECACPECGSCPEVGLCEECQFKAWLAELLRQSYSEHRDLWRAMHAAMVAVDAIDAKPRDKSVGGDLVDAAAGAIWAVADKLNLLRLCFEFEADSQADDDPGAAL